MGDPGANNRKLFLWARITNPVLSFKFSSLFISPFFSGFAHFKVFLYHRGKHTVDSTVREGERSKLLSREGPRSGVLQAPRPDWGSVEPWLCAEGMADLGAVLAGS